MSSPERLLGYHGPAGVLPFFSKPSFQCKLTFRYSTQRYLNGLLCRTYLWITKRFLLFAGALEGWLTNRNIPVSPESDAAGQKRDNPVPQHPNRYFQKVTVDRVGRKRALADVQCVEPDLVDIPEVYTDGSYAPEGPGQGFAGDGVWFGPMDPRNVAQPLEGPMQIVNQAEPLACIASLRVAPRGQVLRIVTDSKYVYDGIPKHLQRWRLQGRPFPNADLWQQLQSESSARIARALWRHVYSHIGVVGNERADALANSGQLAHPQRRQFLRGYTVSVGRLPVFVPTACRAR